MSGRSRRGSPYQKSRGILDLGAVNRARLEFKLLESEAQKNPNRNIQLQVESARRHWLILLHRWWQSGGERKGSEDSVPSATIMYMTRDQMSEAIKATKSHNEADTNLALREVLNCPANYRFPVIFSQPSDESDEWIRCDVGMPDGSKKWVIVAKEFFDHLGRGKIEHPMIEIPD